MFDKYAIEIDKYHIGDTPEGADCFFDPVVIEESKKIKVKSAREVLQKAIEFLDAHPECEFIGEIEANIVLGNPKEEIIGETRWEFVANHIDVDDE